MMKPASTACARIALWTLVAAASALGSSGTAIAQTLQGGVQQNENPATEVAPPAPPPPDLRKYLLPGGRFIDTCAYWHDHPDADTLMYGWPDHFPPGQMGETRSFNGQPAPYGRCARDPCAPFGAICWRNPAAKGPPPSPNAAAYNLLREKGCTVGPGGQITCPAPQTGPPSGAGTPGGYDPCLNPVPPPTCPGRQAISASTRTSRCQLMPGGGIACDTSDGGGAGLSGSADSHGDVPNSDGNMPEGTGAGGNQDGGLPQAPPLYLNNGKLPGGVDQTGSRDPTDTKLTGGSTKTPNPALEGEAYPFGEKLTINIKAGWQENHEAKGKLPAGKYWASAEGTIGTVKDAQGTPIKDQYGNPMYYINLRHLIVRSTGEDMIKNPEEPLQIPLHTVFLGY
jgi:hypothetical protein